MSYPPVASNMYEKNVQISNMRSWFCLGKRHSSLLYATKKQSHERCSVKPCFFQFFKILWLLFLCEFLFQKKRTSDCFCVDMPSIRFGLGSSSFGCGAAVGFPDPSFRGERPPDRISRWVWASLGDLGDTWKLWICQVLLSPFVVSRPRRTHWKSSIREIRITWRDTQLLVVPGT